MDGPRAWRCRGRRAWSCPAPRCTWWPGATIERSSSPRPRTSRWPSASSSSWWRATLALYGNGTGHHFPPHPARVLQPTRTGLPGLGVRPGARHRTGWQAAAQRMGTTDPRRRRAGRGGLAPAGGMGGAPMPRESAVLCSPDGRRAPRVREPLHYPWPFPCPFPCPTARQRPSATRRGEGRFPGQAPGTGTGTISPEASDSGGEPREGTGDGSCGIHPARGARVGMGRRDAGGRASACWGGPKGRQGPGAGRGSAGPLEAPWARSGHGPWRGPAGWEGEGLSATG